jgi:hypothetical protein
MILITIHISISRLPKIGSVTDWDHERIEEEVGKVMISRCSALDSCEDNWNAVVSTLASWAVPSHDAEYSVPSLHKTLLCTLDAVRLVLHVQVGLQVGWVRPSRQSRMITLASAMQTP